MKTYGRGIVHGVFLTIVTLGLLYTLPGVGARAELARSGLTVEVADPFPDRPVFLVQVDEISYLVCVRLHPDYRSYLQTIRVRAYTQRPGQGDVGLASDDNGPSDLSEEVRR